MVCPYGDELVRCNKDAATGETKRSALASVRYGDLIVPSAAELREAQLLVDVARAQDIVVPRSKLASEWAALALSDRFADVTLRCGDGTRLKAHRLILALRSGPKEEIWIGTNGSDGEVTVVGSQQIWRALLGWAYGDECKLTALNLTERTELRACALTVGWDTLISILDSSSALLKEAVTSATTQPPNTIAELLISVMPTLESPNPRGSDVVFVLDDKSEFKAHSLVLKVRAEHFATAFAFPGRESRERSITVPETDRQTLAIVLRFLYSDAVDLDMQSAVSVLELANFFQLPRLRALCEDFWRTHLAIDNAATVYSIAERFEAAQLRKFAQEFIYSHVSEVVETESFRELDVTSVARLLVDAVKRAQVDDK
jgi:hypothetical protein